MNDVAGKVKRYRWVERPDLDANKYSPSMCASRRGKKSWAIVAGENRRVNEVTPAAEALELIATPRLPPGAK